MNDDAKKAGSETDVKYLEPVRLHVVRLPGGTFRATVEGDRSVLRARFVRAFPVSDREEFIELRDGGSGCVGMFKRLDGMAPETLHNVRIGLDQRYFLPVITEIVRLRDTFETQLWLVKTDRGEMEFSVSEPNRNIEQMSLRRVLIKDMEQNVYEIPDWDRLDPVSRRTILGVI